MEPVDEISQEIEAQKNKIAELRQKIAILEQEDTKSLILNFCTVSAILLEYLTSFLEDNKINANDLRKCWPDECHIAGLLSEGILHMLEPNLVLCPSDMLPGFHGLIQDKFMAKRFPNDNRKHPLQEWQSYKNREKNI